MNRTDRLYALVEELRAVAPRPRSAPWLARRFEVSVRTIERDLDALREAGVPLWAEPGRSGGYTLDRDRTLPPLTLTPAEALAVSVALRSVDGSPLAEAARSAAQKVFAALPADVRRREEQLVARVHRVGTAEPVVSLDVERTVAAAVQSGRVVRMSYVDAAGVATERDVEPLGLLSGPEGWLLVGWCRLRAGVRGFLLPRIGETTLLDEVAAPRAESYADELARIGAVPVRSATNTDRTVSPTTSRVEP